MGGGAGAAAVGLPLLGYHRGGLVPVAGLAGRSPIVGTGGVVGSFQITLWTLAFVSPSCGVAGCVAAGGVTGVAGRRSSTLSFQPPTCIGRSYGLWISIAANPDLLMSVA